MDENTSLTRALNIRYVKLHFTLIMAEDTELPMNKTSALRGGMGEMLLRANCIRDRKCESCDFESECIVRRTMYSKMEIEPAFMSQGDSVGYVLECEDHRTVFQRGEALHFNLILFGKTIVYFSQYLNAFYALGQNGLGKNHSRFMIRSVTNSTGQPILDGQDVRMNAYQVKFVSDYVSYRLKQFSTKEAPHVLKLQSPLTIRYRGEELEELNSQALTEALFRRIFVLNCFEAHEVPYRPPEDLIMPEIQSQDVHPVQVARFSFRKGQKMFFRGLIGQAECRGIRGDNLPWLLAGELIHIGKNTSFGFGRYRMI